MTIAPFDSAHMVWIWIQHKWRTQFWKTANHNSRLIRWIWVVNQKCKSL